MKNKTGREYTIEPSLLKDRCHCYYEVMGPLVINKKARFNYEITETFRAGLELVGYEVKSLKARHGSLDGAYVVVRGGEAFIINMEVPAYQPKNTPPEYDSRRNRRLLLTKTEIEALSGAEIKKGLTIIPLMVYNEGRKVKVEIGIARGKKQFDKREAIKKRESDRDIARTLKND